MVIFWGSQSGRAEVLAKSLATEIQNRFGLTVLVADLDDYDHIHLNELEPSQLVGFILATYGEGDPPDNANGFWSTIRSLPEKGIRIEALQYIVFGLGNSKYRHYNRVADTVDSMLQKCGATRVGDFGKGDDANGQTEDDFIEWRLKTLDRIQVVLNLKDQQRIYQPAFRVEEVAECDVDAVFRGEPHPALLKKRPATGKYGDLSSPSVIKIAQAIKLWDTGRRHCIHFEMDLGENRLLKYRTGDHLVIWPSNPDGEVERMLYILGLQEKRACFIDIKPSENVEAARVRVPSPTTVETLFRYYLEICAPLSREAVLRLAEHAPSESKRIELKKVAADQSEFKSEILHPHSTLADILGDNERWDIPMSFLLETIKNMQPRYYSIASSAAVQPNVASIAVVVDSPQGEEHGCYGLASNFLSCIQSSLPRTDALSCPAVPAYELSGPRNLLNGNAVFGRIRRSAFKLPTKSSTAVILIGAGTGIAPYRGFLQERVRLKKIGRDVGRTMLFAGFRNAEEDYLYRDEWPQYQKALGEGLFTISTAFSRDPLTRKRYVQDVIEEHSAGVLELLENDHRSTIFICGAADMARDVAFRLVSMRSATTGEDEEETAAWLKELRRSARLLEDVWG